MRISSSTTNLSSHHSCFVLRLHVLYLCYLFIRFRDHKGNWVTVSEKKSAVLKEMWKDLMPTDVHIDDNQACVNLDLKTCTCTDHVWRSSLRDTCIHIKAAELFRKSKSDPIDVHGEEMSKLCDFLRRKQMARPKGARDKELASSVNEVNKLFCTYMYLLMYLTIDSQIYVTNLSLYKLKWVEGY